MALLNRQTLSLVNVEKQRFPAPQIEINMQPTSKKFMKKNGKGFALRGYLYDRNYENTTH